MALVNQTLPGFYGGVSQQSPELRFDTQVSEMINCYPTIIGGTVKRPPSTLAYNDNTFPIGSFIYAYDRGEGNEQYIICINSNSQFRIFDIVMNTWVNNWTTNSYLALPSGYLAKDYFSLSTVGDTTFIVNKTKVPAMSGTLDYNGDANWEKNFYYWVKRTNGDAGGNASLRYTYYVYKNGDIQNRVPIYDILGHITGYTYGTVGHNSKDIAAEIASLIGGTAVGSVVKRTAVSTDKWTGSDSWGNQAGTGFQGTIRKLADLPNDFGFPGAVIKVNGDDNNKFTSFYVKYEDNVFKETFRPGLANNFDATTMPHKITIRRVSAGVYQDADGGTTYLKEIEWSGRKVGDEDSASVPSFINYGMPIQDVFFYRNRLGFIAGDNVILSESGEYYNFFPTTVTDVIDSDPIDVAVDSNQAIKLLYASPFNKELLLFGTKAQFVMSAADTLTPKNVSVQQSTAFDIKGIEPVILGPNAYFAVEKNDYSTIREYYVQPDSLSNDAADITAHCPNYLPKNMIRLVGSSKNDMLFALSSDTPNTIYIYNFYWQGEQKAQSAWHKWTFDGGDANIFNIEVIGSNLLVMIERYTGTINLEVIPLEFRLDFSDVNYLDGGSIPYPSSIELTTPGFASGTTKVDDKRGIFILRNIKVNADYGSFYGITSSKLSQSRQFSYNSLTGLYPERDVITSKSFNYTEAGGLLPNNSLEPSDTLIPGTVTYTMPRDNKYTVQGNRDNLKIEITNNISRGFRINTIDIEGTYNKNSRNV